MDTKSRSIKPALAFLAFVLGISLLVFSAAAYFLLFVTYRDSHYAQYFADALQSDYQQTTFFRSAISSRLYSLLDYAAAPEDSAGSPVDAEDYNLLFWVKKDGQTLLSNTNDLTSTQAPDGYNFLLYFDGSKVTIHKDGQEIDVYGDGMFRNTEEDWFVPGYTTGNTPYDPAYADITVCMAAAQTPVQYNTSYGLYSLVQDMRTVRAILIWLLIVPPIAGVALIILSIFWHRHKVRADRAIAWFTGHIWLEIKVLLLIPLCFLGAYAIVISINLLIQGYLHNSPPSYLSVPAVIWWCYFYLNDLRYNFGQLRIHSFCAACVRLLRRQELRWPVQQRMDRRSVLQFLLCIPFFLFCAIWVPWLYDYHFYSGLGPLLLAVLCLAGVGLIAAQLWLMKRNRIVTADMDRLLAYIKAAGEGQPVDTLPLPEDSDLLDAAQSLAHMEDGLRTALAGQMKSERMKVELIANVSHDLKTPLTSIISYTELLQQEPGLPEHVNDYIRILSDKARRLQTMVQDVFEVSKAATGNLPTHCRPIDFAKLLRQTLADMNEAIEASSFLLRVTLPEEPVWIEADGDRLYRVFQNLIGNALKYSLEGSRIYLQLMVEDAQAQAILQNTSRDELPSGVDLTERFVRSDASRTDGGSGLGLSIARTFTEACGGRFQVQTQADLFTATVAFPLTSKRPEADDTPAELS